MDFAKLFQSIEGAVFEVMVWILFLPRTLFRSMFRPRWAIEYLNEEWKKDADERFDDYLSPVLLWLMVAVIPTSSILTLADPQFLQEMEDLLPKVTDPQRLFIATLYSMIIPFMYLVYLEWLNKRPVKKSTLRRSFYMHCYALAPAQFLFGISLFPAAFNPLFFFFTFLSILLLGFYEGFVFQYELKISYMKALMYAFVPQVFMLVIFVGLLGLIL